MTKHVLIVAVVAAITAGCTLPRVRWTKVGAGEEDYYRAQGRCHAASLSAPIFDFGWIEYAKRQQIFGECMAGEGWHGVEEPTPKISVVHTSPMGGDY